MKNHTSNRMAQDTIEELMDLLVGDGFTRYADALAAARTSLFLYKYDEAVGIVTVCFSLYLRVHNEIGVPGNAAVNDCFNQLMRMIPKMAQQTQVTV